MLIIKKKKIEKPSVEQSALPLVDFNGTTNWFMFKL